MADAAAETKLCNNCKKQISANNFIMHEMHCKRHISLCKHCNEPIPRYELDVHYEENHAKMKCPKCGVEVEKMHLEDHEENACSKKPMQCVYCELEMPKDKLNSHLDYCGSRTEQCPKCGVFIMLKEQTKHSDSGCREKPKNNNTADGQVERNTDFMDEIYRKMGEQVRGNDLRPSIENDMFGAGMGARRQANVKHSSKVTNQTADVNRQLATAETEFDRLLAMHLAQDLHQDDGLDQMVRELDKAHSPDYPGPRVRYGQNSFSEDLVMLPCEFCGEPYDTEDLVQHQSGCSLERISAMLPQMTSTNNTRDPTNNRSNGAVQPPSIINNLRNYGPDEGLDDTPVPGYNVLPQTGYDRLPQTGYDIPPQTGYDKPPHTGYDMLVSSGDDMFLPCEFCNELFPMDNLVQHQAMCDGMTMTPRLDSPSNEKRPKPKKKNSFSYTERLVTDFPNLNSKRHQPAPALFPGHYDSDDDNVPGVNRNAHVVHRVQKPKPAINGSHKKTDIASPARETRSTLKKYGAETTDTGDRGDYFTRQGNVSRQNADSATDSWLQPSSTQAERKGSNARVRSTLHNLLNHADEMSSHDLLGHIGGAQAKRRETNPAARQNVSVTPGTTKGAAKVKSSSSARDMQKELSRYASTGVNNAAGASQPRNRSSKPNFEVRVRPSEADEPSDMLSGQRQQRTRANNVFGAPSNKPTTRRRPDNR